MTVERTFHQTALMAALEASPDLTLQQVRDILLAYFQALPPDHVEREHIELQNGDIYMDIRRHEAFLRGEKLSLTPKEFKLLRFLMLNRGIMLMARNILINVWGPGYEHSTQYLRVYISQLREKIGDTIPHRYILTEPGIGYRMDILPPSSQEAA